MSLIAVWSVKVATANMLMLLLFMSGVLTDCPSRTHLFMNSPQRMEGLVGSCLQIPCDFTTSGTAEFDNKKEVFGLWFKEKRETTRPRNAVFSSKNTVQEYPISIIGDLPEKNCTTLFSRLTDLTALFPGVYYLRIENLPYRATAICDPLHITVTDSPPSPTINIPGNLMEAESVTVTCSALTPCPQLPPKLTWNLLNNSRNNMVKNTDGTFTTQIQEIITLTDNQDGFNITCSVAYPVNGGTDFKTAEETRTLSVFYSPKNTSLSISPSSSVSAETTVNLTCFSRAKPPVRNFTWFKISTDGPLKVFEGDFYSFNVTEGGVYYCVATNDVGNGTSATIKLTVNEEFSGIPLKLEAILGGILGILVVLCLVVCCWCLISKRRTSQQTQSQTVEQFSVKTHTHYGENIILEQTPKPSSDSAEDTVYSEVKARNTTNNQTQAADGVEDLYMNSQAGEHASVKTPAEKTKGEEKEGEGEDPIHYGEIVFLEQRPKPSSDSAQDAGHQQDTLYSEVKVRNTTNNQTQAADGVEDLYMNVRNTVDAVVEATHDT